MAVEIQKEIKVMEVETQKEIAVIYKELINISGQI